MNEASQTTTETFSSKAKRSSLLRHDAAGMSSSGAAWLAWYMCAVSLALAALGLFLLALSRVALPGAPVFEQWAEDALVAVGFSTLGAIVAPRFPAKNPIGWLFCAIGLVGAMLLFSGEYAAYSLQPPPGFGSCISACSCSWRCCSPMVGRRRRVGAPSGGSSARRSLWGPSRQPTRPGPSGGSAPFATPLASRVSRTFSVRSRCSCSSSPSRLQCPWWFGCALLGEWSVNR